MPFAVPRRLRTVALAATVAGALTAGPATAAPVAGALTAGPTTPAPVTGQIRYADSAVAVAGSYLVVLRDAPTGTRSPSVDSTAHRLATRHAGTVRQVFRNALAAFEVRLTASAARRLAADPAVAYVEQNQRVDLAAAGVQLDPPSWGLDRIDQRTLPLDNRYAYPNTAPDVDAYVIDTGVRGTHQDLGGRVGPGVDLVDGGPADDCNGHGTHLAGTVGATLHGVAKEVRVHPVRVLNCAGSGTIAQVVAGIDWVSANAARPAVALLALGGGASAALDTAVTNSIRSGVTYVVTAGSSAANACNYSPARVPAALTVAGTTRTDGRMPSGNYGTCLDLYAPGAGITSTWHTGDTATATLSGGSMAAAHVAGCAALTLSAHPTWSPAQVAGHLTSRATVGVVSGGSVSGTPNRLLYCGP